jgi:polyisoprenoid-binding protein YceI
MNAVRTLALALAVLAQSAFASTWDIDPSHSQAGFEVRHLVVAEVRGHFQKMSGTLDLNDKDVSKSKVDVVIDAASIDTNEPKRDEHLKSADFFDAANHPKITFKSTKLEKGSGKDKWKVTGDLTIRGVTKPVVLDTEAPAQEIKDPYGNLRRVASATTTINRKDYGLKWSAMTEAGGAVAGDEVKIILDVEFIKKQPEAPKPGQK